MAAAEAEKYAPKIEVLRARFMATYKNGGAASKSEIGFM